MFRQLTRLNPLGPTARHTRFLSQSVATRQPASPPSAPPGASSEVTFVRYPWFLRRNSRGSLPVYTDIRNGGTRYLVLIRHVEGQANALAEELKRTLFQPGTPEAQRLQVSVDHSQRHVVIKGGQWKNDVMQWLKDRGF
ncbi:hypothetical protein CONPUDRAFT_70220 [Coniophora puteana RWD-64-598 SS2]|uniref:Large ribosomal subunit protein mL49 n=1 Tax=Coniophora puteana (strain RWD-64-598) TaxID=741705 RepID=A0A5M3N271_CONPW|nr:uncharacterized protein CONPUDRAFT_70220 [Coniophora puteana RWD-64-598 SS2]EIW85406.1 hypothetical protein CONPUDRAFT_70220 [Coniophora puteana RWD-64-598 SS2]